VVIRDPVPVFIILKETGSIEDRLVYLINHNNPKILRTKFSEDSKGFEEEREKIYAFRVRKGVFGWIE
jgi:hypothetical protein